MKTQQLPRGIQRIDPHSKRSLKPNELRATPNWQWFIVIRQNGEKREKRFDQQAVPTGFSKAVEFLQAERQLLRRSVVADAEKRARAIRSELDAVGTLGADRTQYAKLISHMPEASRAARMRHLGMWLDARVPNPKSANYDPNDVTMPTFGNLSRHDVKATDLQIVLNSWSNEVRRQKTGKVSRRWKAATLNHFKIALSHFYTTLDGKSGRNPARDLKSVKVPDPQSRARSMEIVGQILQNMADASPGDDIECRRGKPSLSALRAGLLAFSKLTLSELWSVEDIRSVDLGAGYLRLPHYRVVVRFHERFRGSTDVRNEPAAAKLVKLSPEAVRAWREFLAWTDRGAGKPAKMFGYFKPSRLATEIRAACSRLKIDAFEPNDFGTERHPNEATCGAVVAEMRNIRWMIRGQAETKTVSGPSDDFVRASILAYTGIRKAELEWLEPANLLLSEAEPMLDVVHAAKRGKSRRIKLREEAVIALKLFAKRRLFGAFDRHLFDRAVARGARRIIDPVTGERLEFSPHCFRHSFLTEIANASRDIRDAQYIAGHRNLKTTMRYLRYDERGAAKAVDAISIGETATALFARLA